MSIIDVAAAALLAGLSAAGPASKNRSACEQGELAACNDLAGQYASGSGVARDERAADQLYARACEGGYAKSCVNLGLRRLETRGPGDHEHAASLFAKACELRNSLACYRLGLLLQAGDGAPKSPSGAATAHEKACDGGNTWGCHALADLLKKGEGIPSDTERASALYEKACEGGYAPSCLAAGVRSSHACSFAVGRYSGTASIVVEHGHVVELAIFSGSPPVGGGNGCCSLEAKRDEGDERDGGDMASWTDGRDGGLIVRWTGDYWRGRGWNDPRLVVIPTRAGFEIEFGEFSGRDYYCGFDADFPGSITIAPGSRRCRATLGEYE
jgi:TPR repeat protein